MTKDAITENVMAKNTMANITMVKNDTPVRYNAMIKNKALIVGAPRTGFALLLNILGEFGRPPYDIECKSQRAVNLLTYPAGEFLYHSILQFFGERLNPNDLIYNQTFRHLLGGPRWIDTENVQQACVRKYIGVKDIGDFSLLIYLPKFTLHYHDRIHSHYHPQRWANDPDFGDIPKFASMRNPLGTIYSTAASINAITGEYINRFIGREGNLRELFAKYRLTDLELVNGLASHLANYLKDFKSVDTRYNIVRWEDIIQHPTSTIKQIANWRGILINDTQANDIWSKIGYKNLTGEHAFNYRAGKYQGKVDDWQRYLTNEHLALLQSAGLEHYMTHYGYGNIQFFKESDYTPFQREVHHALQDGVTLKAGLEDKNLQVFNWNKSNVAETSHHFKRYNKKVYSKIERAAFSDDNVLAEFSDLVETKMEFINHFLTDAYESTLNASQGNWTACIDKLTKQYHPIFAAMNIASLTRVYEQKLALIRNGLE